MLVAKINPPAKRVIQTSPFTSQEILGEYMIVRCDRIVIGAVASTFNDKIEFEVKFGNIKYEKNLDGSQGQALFDKVTHTRVNFSHQELSDWGTDDTIIYQKIGDKLGFNVVETTIINLPFNN
jgi:hypothetical protein